MSALSQPWLGRNLRSIYRDVDNEQRVQAWKYAILNVSFVYRVATHEDVWWMAANNRQKKKSHGMNMTLTCLQKIFSVLNHKNRHERLHGEIRASSTLICAYNQL